MEKHPQPSEASLRLRLASEALKVANQIKANEGVDLNSPYIWLKVLSAEDLDTLVKELNETYQGTLDEVDRLIYEWRETATVNESGVLEEFFPYDKNNPLLNLDWEN